MRPRADRINVQTRFPAWLGNSPKQRRWSSGIAFAVAALAVIAVSRPLPDAIARAKSDVARSRVLVENAQALVADNESLGRGAAPLPGGDIRAAVDGLLARHELHAVPVVSATGDGRYAIVLDDAPFDELIAALEAIARETGVRVVAATLTARVERGRVRADVTFAR